MDQLTLIFGSSVSKRLNEYVGVYQNDAGSFEIKIELQNEQLAMLFQGREDENFKLEHYHYNLFTWLLSRNQLIKRGRWVLQPADYYIIRFEENEAGYIHNFVWVNDPDVPMGEKFVLQDASRHTSRETNKGW
ncbi:MAG: hypothetical protein M1820_007092 [Bogoriella megaspora]|nr:MAG: hypothetical protein M1820_007092 [Bogoriella megaspora]